MAGDSGIADPERWWAENAQDAGERLDEIFAEQPENPTYRDAMRAAQGVLLIAAPLLALDPELGPERDAIQNNLTRVCDLACSVYREQPVSETELERARFVLTCFEPVGPLAGQAIMAARFALAAILITSGSIVFEEMWGYPAAEAWSLAFFAHANLSEVNDRGGRSEEDFWVRPDEEFVGLVVAHNIDNMVREAGGGETMSSN